MTQERTRAGDILGHPLTVAAVGAIFAGYAGFATGQATTTQRVADMERRIAVVEGKLNGRVSFMVCATRSLDKLMDNAGIEKPCDMNVPD
jgi:hypothetical protein